MRAEAAGPVSCSVRPSSLGVAALGRGLIAASAIALPQAECFSANSAAYADWVALGRPACWCAPYQCDGDADGAAHPLLQYRVYNGDLALVSENWGKQIDDPTLNPCADIDHKAETDLGYRVYSGDLDIIVANWKKKDAELASDSPRE